LHWYLWCAVTYTFIPTSIITSKYEQWVWLYWLTGRQTSLQCIPKEQIFIVTTSMEYSVAVSVSSWIQNAGSVVTLSGQALTGVAITSQSVSLSGDLVLDDIRGTI
jgi:hypothetical protein